MTLWARATRAGKPNPEVEHNDADKLRIAIVLAQRVQATSHPCNLRVAVMAGIRWMVMAEVDG